MQPVNVFEFEALAQTRMEPAAWDYYQSGSDDEVTLRANRTAFERIRLRPRMLVDASTCDMRTTLLGTAVSSAAGPLWFQLYAHDRKRAEELVYRSVKAGYRALVI